jgi:hypothetical protein
MGQITLSRFRGETAFGLGARIFSTFFGGLFGLVMWCVFLSFHLPNPSILANNPHRYISAGSTQGNPYGLCVICAVCFPLFFFARLYCPVPPMLNIVFGVTTCLVRISLAFLFWCFLIVFIVGYRVFLSRSIYFLTCIAWEWVECFLGAFLLAFYLLRLLFFICPSAASIYDGLSDDREYCLPIIPSRREWDVYPVS